MVSPIAGRIDTVSACFATVRRLKRGLGTIAAGVCVACLVEPVTSPPLPIGGACQQSVNHSREGIRRFIGNECVYFVDRRRKPRQIQSCTTNERATIRSFNRRDSLRLMTCCDEVIDVGLAPFGICNLRRRDIPNRLKCPMSSPILSGRPFFFFC